MQKGVVWFREDLRVQDNAALYHASQMCPDQLVAVYLLDIRFWKKHDIAACRVEFILRGLQALQQKLSALNIPFYFLEIKHTEKTASVLQQLLQETDSQNLFYNYQYEVDELRRDATVKSHLEHTGIKCHGYHDQTILPPGAVLNSTRHFYRVFTPFKNAWIKIWHDSKMREYPSPKTQSKRLLPSVGIPQTLSAFTSTIDPNLWKAGEDVANQRLEKFCQTELFLYDKQRDFPALSGTSQLSPYLAAGMISARRCFLTALAANSGALEKGNEGASLWMKQLIWRDFYKHILVAFPRVAMHRAYQLSTEKLPWRYDETQWLAWQSGQTGYPIVDAAMRQLNQTGWMHNRLRMITAMFLAKNLFLHWQEGERYFMQQLIDGDLAENNGGWQWCASTGTDAVPYFRIFNYTRQSERFDPQGDFIRTYCPELRKFDNQSIHDPYGRAPALAMRCGYPKPIVDMEQSRQAAVKIWRAN